MILDVNAWIGTFPFRSLGDTSPARLVARMDRSGIDMACVSALEAAFHRNVQPANEQLAEQVAPHQGRLLPMATINPTYIHWEADLADCHERFGMRGVRLIPYYHGYDPKGPEARKAVAACAERGLPVFIPHRLEDNRQRSFMDDGKTVGPADVAELLLAVPGAHLVLTNARGLRTSPLVQRPELRGLNWYVDLSLAEVHYSLFGEPDLAVVLEKVGHRHLLFGSHMPLSYEAAALVKRAVLPLDEEALADVSYRTAARLLGLTEAVTTGG